MKDHGMCSVGEIRTDTEVVAVTVCVCQILRRSIQNIQLTLCTHQCVCVYARTSHLSLMSGLRLTGGHEKPYSALSDVTTPAASIVTVQPDVTSSVVTTFDVLLLIHPTQSHIVYPPTARERIIRENVERVIRLGLKRKRVI